jgi:hypothetical protein
MKGKETPMKRIRCQLVRILYLFLLAALLGVPGCVPVSSRQVASTSVPSPGASAAENATALVPVPTAKPSSTPTVVIQNVPTAALQTAASPTPTEIAHNVLSAVPVCRRESAAPAGFSSAGILYRSFDPAGYFLSSDDPQAPVEIRFPTHEAVEPLGFTEDGRLLRYVSLSSPMLGSLGRDGATWQQEVPIDELLALVPEGYDPGGWSGFEWVNNDLLSLAFSYRESNQTEVFTNLKFQAILSWQAGAWQNELITRLPDPGAERRVFFSPDLRYAFYEQGGRGQVLYDTLEERVIWRAQPGAGFEPLTRMQTAYTLTVWSPNSQYLALAYKDERWQVDWHWDGLEVLLVDVQNATSRTLADFSKGDGRFSPASLAWSPDNQYLAVQMNYGGEETVMYFYDLEQDALILSCPLSYVGEPSRIYWSSDSRGIVHSYMAASEVTVLHLDRGVAFPLVERGIVYGWDGRFLGE